MPDIAAILVMALIALIADKRLPPADQLPMQWGITGEIGWYAPRRVALASLPLLFGAMLLLLTAFGAYWPLSGVIFITGQLFYLWLVHRHLSR